MIQQEFLESGMATGMTEIKEKKLHVLSTQKVNKFQQFAVPLCTAGAKL